jgi:hypothetical protein
MVILNQIFLILKTMVIILKNKLNNKDPLKFNVVSNTQPTPLKALLVLKIIFKHYIYPTL